MEGNIEWLIDADSVLSRELVELAIAKICKLPATSHWETAIEHYNKIAETHNKPVIAPEEYEAFATSIATHFYEHRTR